MTACISVSGAGLLAKEYIDHGNLVPDDVIVDLIVNELHPIQNHSWLLDGTFTVLYQLF